MKGSFSKWVAAAVVVVLGFVAAHASANTVVLTPGMVPDEQTPRVVNNAPTVQFGPDSWQNAANVPASGYKVNAYVTPTQLFGHSVTINNVASISYYTKAPATQENWFINIYTNPPGDGSFYGKRFFNSDYTGYTSDGLWHQNTVGAIQRSSGGVFAAQTVANWKTTYGGETILFFSPQTNSGLNGNDAQIDGLAVTLTTGEVGYVDFAGAAVVPLPQSAWMGLALIAGLVGFKGVRRYATAE